MSYEIRKTPGNKYQLRENPATRKRSKQEIYEKGQIPESPVLGEFLTRELAADFALAHAKGEFNWQPFDPAAEGSAHRREVLEGNLRR